MANNKLRRELETAISDFPTLVETAGDLGLVQRLLKRSLDALGGPVGDNRPVERPHVPTDAEKADIGRPVADDDFVTSGGQGFVVTTRPSSITGVYLEQAGLPARPCPSPGMLPVGRIDLPDRDATAEEARNAGQQVMDTRPELMTRLAHGLGAVRDNNDHEDDGA